MQSKLELEITEPVVSHRHGMTKVGKQLANNLVHQQEMCHYD